MMTCYRFEPPSVIVAVRHKVNSGETRLRLGTTLETASFLVMLIMLILEMLMLMLSKTRLSLWTALVVMLMMKYQLRPERRGLSLKSLSFPPPAA